MRKSYSGLLRVSEEGIGRSETLLHTVTQEVELFSYLLLFHLLDYVFPLYLAIRWVKRDRSWEGFLS